MNASAVPTAKAKHMIQSVFVKNDTTMLKRAPMEKHATAKPEVNISIMIKISATANQICQTSIFFKIYVELKDMKISRINTY